MGNWTKGNSYDFYSELTWVILHITCASQTAWQHERSHFLLIGQRHTIFHFLLGTSLLDVHDLVKKKIIKKKNPTSSHNHSPTALELSTPVHRPADRTQRLTLQPSHYSPPQDWPPRYFLPSHYEHVNDSAKATNHHPPAKHSLGPHCCQTAPAARPGETGTFCNWCYFVTFIPPSNPHCTPSPHTPWDTFAHSVMAAQQRDAPICSYSCCQGNQCRAIYKGKKKTAATQSCDISTFWSRSELLPPPLPFQLPCDSRKGQQLASKHQAFLRRCIDFRTKDKASYHDFKVSVKCSGFTEENHPGEEWNWYQQAKFIHKSCIPSQSKNESMSGSAECACPPPRPTLHKCVQLDNIYFHQCR